MKIQLTIKFSLPLAFALLLLSMCSMAQDRQAIAGNWIINTDLSDNTDSQVAKALRAMGEKVGRCWLGCEEDRFRGGPKEQELYDRISYDKGLSITLGDQEYLFTYDDNYPRAVFTDGRSQSVSLTGLENVEDFSFAHWEDNSLLVEARPRDGGFANEIYTLIEEGTRLRVEMYIQPRSFDVPLEIVRIYDRLPEN
jgi:hypothetical protein